MKNKRKAILLVGALLCLNLNIFSHIIGLGFSLLYIEVLLKEKTTENEKSIGEKSYD